MVNRSPSPRSISAQPLVGREGERASLRDRLSAVGAGQGGLVLVSGEAGIGKTTLVEDLSLQAEAADALVLWGHAYDRSVTPPYGPWVELASSYQPSDDLPPFPAFLHEREALAAVGSQEALFAQTWAFFATVAAQRPLVLVLEDLHWADQESLSLLRFAARQLARHRVLVLATYRSDDLNRRHPLYALIPLLVREGRAIRLELQRLTDADRRALIEQRYGLPDADAARLAAYLRAHAEGNPLFAGELLRSLEVDRVLARRENGWHLGDLGGIRVPPLLRQVIEARLSRLDAETRRLLDVAAVIGQDVPLELWQRVNGTTDELLAEAVQEGLDRHLLGETPDGRVRFTHALVREALYVEIVPVRRRGWHRKVGEALAESSSSDPELVAHHFEQAGDARAAEWLLRAGERARRAYAWTTAAARFEAALAILPEHGAPATERAVLHFRVAHLQRYADPHRALTLLQTARQLAFDAGEPALASYCLYMSGLLQCFTGEVDRGIVIMQRATTDFRALSARERERLGHLVGADFTLFGGGLVLWLANSGRLEETISLAERMIAETPPPTLSVGQAGTPYGDCLHGLACALAFCGRPLPARRTFRRARAMYRAIGHHHLVMDSCRHELEMVQLPYFAEERDARTLLAEEAEKSWRKSSGAVSSAWPVGLVGLELQVLAGNWDVARRIAAAAYEQSHWPIREPGAACLARLAGDQGDLGLTRQIIGEVLPDGPATEPGNSVLAAALPLQRLAVQLALSKGERIIARAWLEAHDRWLAWSGAVLGQAEGALLWARYHHVNGDRALARQYGEHALALASDPRQPLALIAIYRFLGRLSIDGREFPNAEAHLQQSLTLADACAAQFERALSLLAYAELRIAQSRFDQAQRLLAEVEAICAPLNARPTLERVAQLRRQLRPAAGKPDYPLRLSEREVEVLRLVTQGLTDVEVAEKLFISPRTVSTHLTSIYTKLQVSSRTAATRFALEHQLV